VLEVDEEALLEEDLENQADLEEEVDEETLEVSLDHLVHDGDVDEEEAEGSDPGKALTLVAFEAVVAGSAVETGEATELDDLEIEDLEDREESLDRVLREKLAGDEEPADDPDELAADGDAGAVGITVPSCRADEFVCPSCFLVRSRTQRTGRTSLCHDCSE
jgi:hypothetical protein